MRTGVRILSAALLLLGVTSSVAFSIYRPDKTLRVATGFVATRCAAKSLYRVSIRQKCSNKASLPFPALACSHRI